MGIGLCLLAIVADLEGEWRGSFEGARGSLVAERVGGADSGG
jgi:hypothetical protein